MPETVTKTLSLYIWRVFRSSRRLRKWNYPWERLENLSLLIPEWSRWMKHSPFKACSNPLVFLPHPVLYPHLCSKLPPDFGSRKILDSPPELTWQGVFKFPYRVSFHPRKEPLWVPLGPWNLENEALCAGTNITWFLAWVPSHFEVKAQPLPLTAAQSHLAATSCEQLLLSLRHLRWETPPGGLPHAWTPSGIIT